MTHSYFVFVYGTLRKSERNHHLLEYASCLEESCWTNGLLFDTGLGYPAVKESIDGRVQGELYIVNESQLGALDELEGYYGPGKKNLYNRIAQKVFTKTGDYEAYLYILHPENEGMLKAQIESGDWVKKEN